MVSGRNCTAMDPGKQNIGGSVPPCLLDGVKLKYNGTFQLMQQQGPTASGILAITNESVSSERQKYAHTLVPLVPFK